MTTPSRTPFPNSPPWSLPARLAVLLGLLVLGAATIAYFDRLFLYLLVAGVLTYLLRPIVDFLHARSRLPRWVPTLAVYLLTIGATIAVPVSFIPSIVRQVATFISNLPGLLQQLVEQIGEFLRDPLFTFRGVTYYIPLDQIQIEEYQRLLGNIVSLIGSSLGSVTDLAGNLATGIAGAVSWLAFVFFVSFYLTKDAPQIPTAIVRLAPADHQDDVRGLLTRLDEVWSSFLRGQILLMAAIGMVVFVLASILGLPNPLALGVIAGLLEIVPYVGPVLSAVPGVLLAYFQTDSSWLGQIVGPFWFTLIVGFMYWLVQQLENYFLLPRIMGRQLKLHPILVFVAAIAGWQLAGVWGIFLASPAVATLLLLARYGYSKAVNRAWEEEHAPPPPVATRAPGMRAPVAGAPATPSAVAQPATPAAATEGAQPEAAVAVAPKGGSTDN